MTSSRRSKTLYVSAAPRIRGPARSDGSGQSQDRFRRVVRIRRVKGTMRLSDRGDRGVHEGKVAGARARGLSHARRRAFPDTAECCLGPSRSRGASIWPGCCGPRLHGRYRRERDVSAWVSSGPAQVLSMMGNMTRSDNIFPCDREIACRRLFGGLSSGHESGLINHVPILMA